MSVEEIMRSMNKGLYDLTDNGKCTSCGQCCSNLLPLSKKDISRIKHYLKSHNIKPCRHLLPTSNPVIDMTCPFRDDMKKICTIYPVRPAVCRDFKCDKAKNGYVPNEIMFRDQYVTQCVSKVFFGRGGI